VLTVALTMATALCIALFIYITVDAFKRRNKTREKQSARSELLTLAMIPLSGLGM
jgi:hypothetical protein